LSSKQGPFRKEIACKIPELTKNPDLERENMPLTCSNTFSGSEASLFAIGDVMEKLPTNHSISRR
jgi:hypothetical protein